MEEIVQAEFTKVFGNRVAYSLKLTKNDVPGWDSLRWVVFLVALEKKFGIRFSTASVPTMKTLQDVVDYLRANQPGGA